MCMLKKGIKSFEKLKKMTDDTLNHFINPDHIGFRSATKLTREVVIERIKSFLI